MTRKTSKLIAEICLYGNRETGAGWLARLEDGALLGDGESRPGRSFTEAVWLACDQIRRLRTMAATPKPWTGTVRVFAPGGERMAETELNHPATFGDLKWQPAIHYVLAAADIMAAAE